MQKLGKTLPPDEQPAVRTRGRPRAFDRDAALAKATCLFWSKGYEATSISDLTEAMGIGSPSLYAAFGSKEALYAEALGHYRTSYDVPVWGNFQTGATARESVESLLRDSASSLTEDADGMPRGCMVALSAIGNEGHPELGEMVRAARAEGFERIKRRLSRAVKAGEIAPSTDIAALARFLQAVHHGMSILARDGASRAELDEVADVAMLGWEVRTQGGGNAGT